MITYLKGTLAESIPNRATIDIGGIGYEVAIPLSTYDTLGAIGGQVKVLTHLHVRETEHSLFGFATEEERDLFRLLINRVSGIGPKLGMAVLSGMAVNQFKANVVNGDVAALSKISGLGKKTAERIVLELKDKVGVAEAWQVSSAENSSPENIAMADAVLGLIALGYKQVEAQKALKAIQGSKDVADGTPDAFIRAALRVLTRG